MSSKDTLGDRMKDYESISKTRLPRRSWWVIRLDGKAFHTWTKGREKPFDIGLNAVMDLTMGALAEQIEGAVFGYTQSDEISILVKPGGRDTQPWFDGQVQKIVSVSASIATGTFNLKWEPVSHAPMGYDRGLAYFDARVFALPSAGEVSNYLKWRQQDCTRNSVSMAAQAHFSHKELQGLKRDAMIVKLDEEKGVFWYDYPDRFKFGAQTWRETVDHGTYVRSHWEVAPAPEFDYAPMTEWLTSKET